MTITKTPGIVRAVAAFGFLVLFGSLSAAEPEASKGTALTIIDGAGKEFKIKAWKITTGTRTLDWLADHKEPVKGKRATGPQALAMREEGSTNFVDGILTLIPLERIRSIDYDLEAETVSVALLAGEKEDDIVLKGSTKFKGINKLGIEAEVDKGDLGVAEIKFQGGVVKGSIRGVRFAEPKAAAPTPAAGRVAVIKTADKKDKGPFRLTDPQVLYRMGDGSEKLMPIICFKKSLKVDLAKLDKLTASEEGDEGPVYIVTLKDGEEHTLTLLPSLPDEKQSKLEGLVGRVPAGYRLFPINLISELTFEEAKKE